jgi:hypothetical protein
MISEWILSAGTLARPKMDCLIGKHPIFQVLILFWALGNGITFSVIGMELVSEMLKNKKHPLAENILNSEGNFAPISYIK